MSSEEINTAITRGRKGSTKDSGVSLNDIAKLLRESEERIKNDMQQFFQRELATVTSKLEKLESRFSFVQQEIVRVDDCIARMREVIVDQQSQIELHEKKLRECNLIVHNVAEGDLSSTEASLKDDTEEVRGHDFKKSCGRCYYGRCVIHTTFGQGERVEAA